MLLIFDIDLTLCDNFERKKGAFEKALGRKLCGEEEEILRRELAENAVVRFGIDDEGREKILFHFFWDEDLYELDVPLAGAVDVVRELSKKHRIYYVTGRPSTKTARKFLRKYGFPDAPVYAEIVGPGESRKKVKMFEMILARENLRWGVAVGDLPGDALAAKECGLYAVGVLSEERRALRETLEEVCDVVIQDIRELPELLERIDETIKY
jgi:phosphoglycolate phosphatase-like HAD superfamily hydrolase